MNLFVELAVRYSVDFISERLVEALYQRRFDSLILSAKVLDAFFLQQLSDVPVIKFFTLVRLQTEKSLLVQYLFQSSCYLRAPLSNVRE